MGPAVSYLERKGIQTNIGNLNRDIKAANSLMQSIRQMVRSLKGWLSGLKEKKAALLEALEQAKEPTIPELLSRYLDMRSEERTGWTSKGKLKGTVGDFNKVMEALDFLRRKEISTVESLDAYLDKVSGEILSVKADIQKSERRIKARSTPPFPISPTTEPTKRFTRNTLPSAGKPGRRSLPTNTGKNWTPTLPPSVFSKPIRRNCPLIQKN